MANLEISLKWNGYQNNILSSVKELFKDQCLSDVTLVSEGQSFKAHKVILSACSSVFRTIFQQNPHKDPIIVLHDINTASLWTLLTFMYNGEVSVTEEFLPVLLKTAESLSVYGLSTGAEKTTPEDVKIRVPEKQQAKKRKKTDFENNNNNNKCKKISPILEKPDVLPAIESQVLPKDAPIIPKEEPLDSPLTDYSASSESADIDIRLFIDEKPSFSPENNSVKSVSKSSGRSVKKCINEVSSTQPCLNTVDEKSSNDFVNEHHKDNVEIDKEVENVLQSGTIVESLNVASENFNTVSTEPNSCKEKSNTYANPSFPCPFCPRVYNSWGYRRRHVKSQHMTNRLSCKWCVDILPSTGAWYNHSTREHGIPHEEARNSLVVMVEAHAVLTLNEPSVAQLLGQVGIKEGKNGGEQKN